MIQDFAVEQDNQGLFDIIIDEDSGEYKADDGFDTAINYQVFVDRRGSSEDSVEARNRRGFVGDVITKESGYESGSFLWVKDQSRNTIEDRNEAANFVNQSLDYFVAIGAVKNINSSIIGNQISIDFEISNNEVKQYTRLWRLTSAT